MRILFIEPKYYSYKNQVYFPIGPAYVAGALAEAGHTIEAIDANKLQASDDAILEAIVKRIRDGGIQALAMGGLCTTFNFQRKIFCEIRCRFPEIFLVSGGNLLSSEPELCLEHFRLDFGIIGEAEVTAVELFETIESGQAPDKVPGLIHRRNGNLAYTAKRKALKNLDRLPFPAWSLFATEEQIRSTGSMPIFTSRSCPFHCTFCFHPRTSYYRKRSVKNVVAEITHLKDKFGIQSFGVCDELFALDKEWVTAFCNEIIELGLDINWVCQMRADDAEYDVLRRMRDAGCNRISMGFESGSDAVLRSMKKRISVSTSEKAIDTTRKAGLPVTGGIILGDFAETPATIKQTVDFVKKKSVIPVSDIGMIVPYPGSAIYYRCIEEGLIGDKLAFIRSLGAYDKLRVNMTRMADQELIALQEKASQEIYDHFLKHHRGRVIKILDTTSDASRFEFECPNCEHHGTERITGLNLEIHRYCPACCYPIYFHPHDVPHIARSIATFIEKLHLISNGSTQVVRILITPVGHDFMRLSGIINFPLDNVIGFLDSSNQRLKHKFMGYNVYPRTPQTVSDLNPSAIVICSTAFQEEIASELDSWNLPNIEIAAVFDQPN